MPMIFFNISWMNEYRGITDEDQPLDGGSWEEKHEVCNFAPVGGRCFGFVQPPNGNSVAIERIGATADAPFVDSVTIVWTAKARSGGTVVVGFYLKARLHRDRQSVLGSVLHAANHCSDYFAECREEDALLLPVAQRRHRIPRGEGAMGQSLVWYADTPTGAVEESRIKDWLDRLIDAKASQTTDMRLVETSDGTVGAFDEDYRVKEEDVEDILNGDLAPTEKATLIRARLGQGRFRRELLALWQSACSVTGCRVAELLRASHIKPWRECANSNERLDPNNGLLLSANLDALFDRGLIGFDANGTMLVSSAIAELDRKALGLGGKLTKKPNDWQAKYLKYHRDFFDL